MINCIWMGEFRDLPAVPYVPGWTFYGGPWAKIMKASNQYKAHVKQLRGEITVILPVRDQVLDIGSGFCIDSAHSEPDDGQGWEVTVDPSTLVIGELPHITVAPSINCIGMWHGFLVDGVLSEDLG